jgi:hypothetical protein
LTTVPGYRSNKCIKIPLEIYNYGNPSKISYIGSDIQNPGRKERAGGETRTTGYFC